MADVEKVKIKGVSYDIKDPNAVSVQSQSLTAAQQAQARTNIGVSAATDVYTKTETDTLLNGKISTTAKGTSNGVAELDANGKVPSSQLPSFVDDVVEGYYKTDSDRFYEESTFTTLMPPVAGKAWIDIPTNKSYRWTGSVYVRVDEGVQIGETADTAYAGNKGKANADAIAAIKDGVSIDSFSDVETALAGKVDAVQGKGLSTNDYTSAEKTKLAGLENYDDTGIQGDISAIEEVIPSTATSQNQLATSADIPTDAVKYTAQTLTAAQQAQARENIGAANAADVPSTEQQAAWSAKQDALTFDSVPTQSSTNPVTSGGVYTAVDAVNKRCDDIIDIISGKPIVYGFHVNPDESDPAYAVTYLADAVGMTPAAMGTTTFNYGSWKDAFFMPRPCMLKYDGTVDYYLDPNDYSKKLDGTASDISNYSYNGNAMMEFPKLWFKFESGAAEGEGYFYVSNKQVDSSYYSWANYDSDGNQIDHFYMGIYNGVIYDGKMRSLSEKKLSSWSTTAYSSSATYAVDNAVNYDNKMWKCVTAVETAEEFDPTKWEQFGFNGNTTGQQEVDAAAANDTTAKSEWYIDTWCDRVLITALLYLMGKSLDLQSIYGRGIDSGSQTAAENYVTGAANDKGLFYGDTANGNSVVKVFGIENFWACKWRRTAGCIGLNNGKVAYKMTLSTADGSTATAYNTDGTGYLIDNTIRPSSGYVSKMGWGAWGLIPRSVTGGNSNIYYCDFFYTNKSNTTFAIVGGGSYVSLGCGFSVALDGAFAVRGWGIAAVLSCKPLANKEV